MCVIPCLRCCGDELWCLIRALHPLCALTPPLVPSARLAHYHQFVFRSSSQNLDHIITFSSLFNSCRTTWRSLGPWAFFFFLSVLERRRVVKAKSRDWSSFICFHPGVDEQIGRCAGACLRLWLIPVIPDACKEWGLISGNLVVTDNFHLNVNLGRYHLRYYVIPETIRNVHGQKYSWLGFRSIF